MTGLESVAHLLDGSVHKGRALGHGRRVPEGVLGVVAVALYQLNDVRNIGGRIPGRIEAALSERLVGVCVVSPIVTKVGRPLCKADFEHRRNEETAWLLANSHNQTGCGRSPPLKRTTTTLMSK